MYTHTCTCTSTGTLHRVRGLRVRPFSITPPCRQSHSVFGGIIIVNVLVLFSPCYCFFVVAVVIVHLLLLLLFPLVLLLICFFLLIFFFFFRFDMTFAVD